MSWTARRFLGTSLSSSTLVAMGSTTIPTFLGRSAQAAGALKTNERILVVVQLLGGNDGFNTVVPHGLDGYNRGRRALRLPAGHCTRSPRRSACTLDGGDGQDSGTRPAGGRSGGRLPQPGPLALPIDGDLGGGEREQRRQGPRDRLAGRVLDPRPAKAGDDPPGLHVGRLAMPPALWTRKAQVPSVESLESYKLQLAGTEQRETRRT